MTTCPEPLCRAMSSWAQNHNSAAHAKTQSTRGAVMFPAHLLVQEYAQSFTLVYLTCTICSNVQPILVYMGSAYTG